MTGLLVFMGIPLLFALMALQSPFFQNWRFFAVLSLSVYFSLWTSSLHQAILPLLLPAFTRKYPLAELSVQEDSTRELENLLPARPAPS